MLSVSKFSALNAPLNSNLSETSFAASTKTAYADLSALLSIPPARKIKSAKARRFPCASKVAIESSFLDTSYSSFLN